MTEKKETEGDTKGKIEKTLLQEKRTLGTGCAPQIKSHNFCLNVLFRSEKESLTTGKG